MARGYDVTNPQIPHTGWLSPDSNESVELSETVKVNSAESPGYPNHTTGVAAVIALGRPAIKLGALQSTGLGKAQ